MGKMYFFLTVIFFSANAFSQPVSPVVSSDSLNEPAIKMTFAHYTNPQTAYTKQRLVTAAENGNAVAMVLMARLYQKENPDKLNNDSTIYWYTKAAEAGNGGACYYLGSAYQRGSHGIKQNFSKSAYYFYKGMLLGNPGCKDGVAYSLYKGLNKKQDYDSAFLLFHQLAVEKRYSNGMYFTGIFYRNGYGTARNQDSSIYWLTQAAKKNDKQSIHELANDQPENPEEPILPPAETQTIEPNTTYHRVKHNMSAEALPGAYAGYIIRYDWSGKHVLSVFPVQATFSGQGEHVTGTWVEGSDTANISAIFTDSNLIFSNTRYLKNDHYSRLKPEKMQFKNARFNLLQQPDSLYITGNIQLFDLKREVPARPIYIHLSKAAGPAIVAKFNNPLEVKAFPNPFQSQLKVEFVLSSSQKVSISLVSMQGQIILKEDAGLLQPGTYQHDVKTPATMAAGNYILLVTAGSEKKQINVLKMNN